MHLKGFVSLRILNIRATSEGRILHFDKMRKKQGYFQPVKKRKCNANISTETSTQPFSVQRQKNNNRPLNTV